MMHWVSYPTNFLTSGLIYNLKTTFFTLDSPVKHTLFKGESPQGKFKSAILIWEI